MNTRIAWALIAGCLLGVFLRSFFTIGLSYAAFSALLASTALAFAYFDSSRRTKYVIVSVALFSLSLGIFRMHIATFIGDPALSSQIGKRVTLEGVVFTEPDVRESSVRLYVHADTSIYGSATSSVNAGILIAAPAHSEISYGDRVRARGELRLPESFDTGVGRTFDYPLYLAKDGVLYELAFAQASVVGSGEGNPIIAAAISAKQKYLDGLHRALPEPESGLAGGITVGDKRAAGEDLSETFRLVGLVHIVVLSGYNITLVMNAMRFLVSRFPLYLQWGSVSFAVVFFILMSGGAASAVRAGAMALIAVFARATGRVFLAGRILGVVALAMVLWDPFTLAFDPSFQLSALATLGLISFTPFFSSHLWWITARFGFREIASSTLATQVTVLPLLLYQNGQLSLVSLPANLLALIAVSPAMFASFVAALAGLFSGPLAPVIGFPAYALLAYIIGVAEFFGSLPFASVSLPTFRAWWLLPMYSAMVLFILKYGRSRTHGGQEENVTSGF